MSSLAKIVSAERTITVPADTTLLSAALAAGVSYPHGCRSGRCGACKTRLLHGKVELLPHTPFSLTVAEREHGLILACRARLCSDIVVRWLAQKSVAHPVIRTSASIMAFTALTHDIFELRLRPTRPFELSPGQYARITFPDLPARDYSFAPVANADEIAFHIRIVPGGRVSPAIVRCAVPRLDVLVEGPHGDAYLREDHTGPILAAAGGSGLGPILAIVEHAVMSGMHQPIHIYFGARDTRDIYATDKLVELAAIHPKLSVQTVLSSPTSPCLEKTGFLHEVIASDLSPDKKGWKAYVAGPPSMVEAVGALCRQQGMRDLDFHADAFFTPDGPAPDTMSP